MEALLQKELGSRSVKLHGAGGSGFISSGAGYMTDNYGHVFIKENTKSGARIMFEGEYESLKAIAETNTVRVPKAIKIFDYQKDGAILVMEYLDMSGLRRQSAKLGEQLARMHLHNAEMIEKAAKQDSSVHKDNHVKCIKQFGFHVTTCCGFIPQDNTWNDDWLTFFSRQKLKCQVDRLIKETNDRDLLEYWPRLERKLPEYFKDVTIVPALMHGDLWGGNAAETGNEPVIFDPASFYGHSEFDLGISTMFGGFGQNFFKEYFKLIPKQPGYDRRLDLYRLFHYLNHWNHFGGGYKGSSMSIMKALC